MPILPCPLKIDGHVPLFRKTPGKALLNDSARSMYIYIYMLMGTLARKGHNLLFINFRFLCHFLK